MITLYKRFIVWIWWKFSVEEDEFSPKLDILYAWENDFYDQVVARRNIAHLLDSGFGVFDIDDLIIDESKILSFKW